MTDCLWQRRLGIGLKAISIYLTKTSVASNKAAVGIIAKLIELHSFHENRQEGRFCCVGCYESNPFLDAGQDPWHDNGQWPDRGVLPTGDQQLQGLRLVLASRSGASKID